MFKMLLVFTLFISSISFGITNLNCNGFLTTGITKNKQTSLFNLYTSKFDIAISENANTTFNLSNLSFWKNVETNEFAENESAVFADNQATSILAKIKSSLFTLSYIPCSNGKIGIFANLLFFINSNIKSGTIATYNEEELFKCMDIPNSFELSANILNFEKEQRDSWIIKIKCDKIN